MILKVVFISSLLLLSCNDSGSSSNKQKSNAADANASCAPVPQVQTQSQTNTRTGTNGFGLNDSTNVTPADAANAPNGDITAWYDNIVKQNNAKMDSMLSGIIQQNMQDPKVQAMFKCYQAQGGTMTFEQYAYMYAATGGFSQQGIAQYNQVTRSIQAKEAQAYGELMKAQANRADAVSQWQNGYSENQQEAGRILSGNATYSSPTGDVVLPYLSRPGMYTFSNQDYFVDERQNFYQIDPNSGLMTPLTMKR